MRSSTEYLRLFQSLLPKGKAWTREEGSTSAEFFHGQADEFARLDQRSYDLLRERNTLYTNELLVDHEIDLGLPDECSAEDETIAERVNAVHARFIQLGQQFSQYFIDLAEAFGWIITITEYYPFISGVSASGDSCGESINIFYWKVTIDLTDANIVYFTSGGSQSGDLLTYIPDVQPFICSLNKIKPAHTNLIYDYNGVEFDLSFSSAFDAFLSESDNYLFGAFNKAFSQAFDKYNGGEYSDDFDISFRKQA